MKWETGYTCRKCGHKKSQIRKDFSRTCNICSDTESPTSGTLFHRVKFGLRKAFFICFEMSTTTKSLSALQMSVRYGVSENTARLFMHKVRQIPSNNGKNFKALHILIHQVKSWIRTTYSWVSDFNINRYLNEYSFRINRSQSKNTVFNNLIKRMVQHKAVFQTELVCR